MPITSHSVQALTRSTERAVVDTKLVKAKQLAEFHQILLELHRYEQAYQEQKIVFFRPNPSGQQSEFFEAEEAFVRLVLGSNRSGKTVVGVMEAIAHAMGFRPWYPPGHPLRTVRLADGNPIPVPNIGRIIAQNYEQAIRQTILEKLREWMPRYVVKRIEKNTRGIPVCFELHNGSKIHLMSNDQDDMAFEGPNGHWFWADEPIDYRKYTGLKRGLVDFNGHCWLTMTPLTQPWINDIIVKRANEPGSGVRMFKFSIWDNWVGRGGHLSKAAIDEFLADLREDELEARLHANFLHLAGLVYKQWEPRPPFWVDPFEIPQSWPRVQFVDPHGRKPLALMWAAVSPTNQLVVYRSVFKQELRTIKQAAEYIKAVEGWGDSKLQPVDAEPVVLRIIDWSAEEEERTSGMSVRNKFSMEGLHYVKAKKHDAAAGYDAIHEALRLPDYEWAEPGLVVFNTCSEVKQNFMNFCFAEHQSSRMREIHGQRESYVKNNDDFIDLIRYYYQHRFTYAMLAREARKMYDAHERWQEKTLEHNGAALFQRDGLHTGYGANR